MFVCVRGTKGSVWQVGKLAAGIASSKRVYRAPPFWLHMWEGVEKTSTNGCFTCHADAEGWLRPSAATMEHAGTIRLRFRASPRSR